jgi:hypothetical protein
MVKFLSISLFLLACFSVRAQTDSICKEIKSFEKVIFNMELTENIDTTAQYNMLFKWVSTSENRKNASSKRKKTNYYSVDGKTILTGKEMQSQLDVVVPKNGLSTIHLFKKKDKWFDSFTSHEFDFGLHIRYVAIFEHEFMIIRDADYNGNVTALHTGPSFNTVTYYYFKKNE